MQAKRIAVATDFSANADKAVEKAFALARRRGADIFLVHVIPPVLNSSPLMSKAMHKGDDGAINHVASRLEQLSRDELENRYLKPLDYPQAEALCLKGKVVRSILGLIDEQGVELLVVGATGSTGLAESLFGSTASKLMRKAPCSVLVVRSGQESSA
jgi:nucleotide-binding universal stress UspA family protein